MEVINNQFNKSLFIRHWLMVSFDKHLEDCDGWQFAVQIRGMKGPLKVNPIT